MKNTPLSQHYYVQIISMLVAEIILCIKEVNHKTRVAAYELLVSLAKTMHENDPPSAGPEEDVVMGVILALFKAWTFYTNNIIWLLINFICLFSCIKNWFHTLFCASCFKLIHIHSWYFSSSKCDHNFHTHVLAICTYALLCHGATDLFLLVIDTHLLLNCAGLFVLAQWLLSSLYAESEDCELFDHELSMSCSLPMSLPLSLCSFFKKENREGHQRKRLIGASYPGEGEEIQSQGGLNDLFNMVLAGLIGATPHMVSASVMALARLLYDFSSHLEVAAPQLLPVVLSLLRSKAREIVKSVLGFVKVWLYSQFFPSLPDVSLIPRPASYLLSFTSINLSIQREFLKSMLMTTYMLIVPEQIT